MILRARSIAAMLLAGLALAGCADSSDTTESADNAESATSSPARSASGAASSAASGATRPSAVATAYPGITVTGDPGAAPTVTLADDFAPATELGVLDLVEGTGDPVTGESTITVQYVGVGQQSRAVFDSSWASGRPATFGLREVIEGWQQGLEGMRAGGRRLLVIPGSLAYGPAGHPPVIGPDETLVFVVDVIEPAPSS